MTGRVDQVLRASSCNGDCRATRATTDQPKAPACRCRADRKRFATTRTLYLSRLARRKPPRFDRPIDPGHWRSDLPKPRLPPDDLPGAVARARARNGDNLRRAPVELHVRLSRDRPAAQRPPPAIDDWRQRPAATLPLCVQRRLPHPVFPRTEEPEPGCLAL